MTVLKRKHLLGAKEEELRKEKEQLALETELAAASAKLHMLEINSKCGSKGSDGMNSYIERNRNSVQGTSRLSPHAHDNFVPQKEAHAVIVRNKQVAITQTDIKPVITNTQVITTQMAYTGRESYSVRPKQAAVTQTDSCPVIS